jgi:hypothetical protein
MAKIFITVVVLYALFVAICLFRLNLSKRRQKDIVGKGCRQKKFFLYHNKKLLS